MSRVGSKTTAGTRRWNPQGTAENVTIPKLPKELKQQIALIFKTSEYHSFSAIEPNLSAFFLTLQKICFAYHQAKNVHDRSKPRRVAANLSNLNSAYQRLLQTANNLDANSQELLAWSSREQFENLLMDLGKTIDQAQTEQKRYPRNVPRRYRQTLASRLAREMESSLNIKPTQTKNGTYISILEVVLGHLEGREAKGVHELARKALKNIVWEETGGVLCATHKPNPK